MNSPIASLGGRRAQSFTNEEEKLFQRRFENGYDLSNDLKYISWLHIYHPEEAIRLCELIIDPTETKAREKVEKSRAKRELLEEQDMKNCTVTSKLNRKTVREDSACGSTRKTRGSRKLSKVDGVTTSKSSAETAKLTEDSRRVTRSSKQSNKVETHSEFSTVTRSRKQCKKPLIPRPAIKKASPTIEFASELSNAGNADGSEFEEEGELLVIQSVYRPDHACHE